MEKGSKRVANLYLPTETVEALDRAREQLPFSRSELANLAIREGLPRTLARLARFPRLNPVEVPATA